MRELLQDVVAPDSEYRLYDWITQSDGLNAKVNANKAVVSEAEIDSVYPELGARVFLNSVLACSAIVSAPHTSILIFLDDFTPLKNPIWR
jgi:hypothetical protein